MKGEGGAYHRGLHYLRLASGGPVEFPVPALSPVTDPAQAPDVTARDVPGLATRRDAKLLAYRPTPPRDVEGRFSRSTYDNNVPR